MQNNDAVLKIISNETLDSINDLGIITPSIYKSHFIKHAQQHDASISEEEQMTNRILDEKIQMFSNYNEQTSKNVISLSNNTSKAISAIQDKDENILNQVLQETNDLKKELEKLKEAVYRDELTHARNRKWLNDNYLQNDTFTSFGTLAIIDLNFFKLINDTYGHIIGDKVLIFISSQLARIEKNVIRYGGDEFILIFDDMDQDSSFAKIDKIRESIIAKKLKAGDASFRVSFSIGTYEFEDGDKLANVIELADKNMYNDKTKIKKRITGIE